MKRQVPGVKEQVINIPAVNLAVTGLRAQEYVIRHTAKLKQYPLDAGMDLYPRAIKEVIVCGHLAVLRVNTFLVAHIPPGGRARIEPRSSSITKLEGGEVLHGLIDGGYNGELLIQIKCPVHQEVQDRVSAALAGLIASEVAIAQLTFEQNWVIMPYVPAVNPPSLGRGGNGFGSSDGITLK